MTFDEVLSQVQDLLQREKRVSYRGLKRRFTLDDEYLEDLKEELIGAKRLATDEDGRFLVWTGGELKGEKAKGGNGETGGESELRTPNLEPLLAERRQLTVMFCDLVGSTALSAQLDPEELREVIRAYQATCTEVIRRYDGHVAQYLGDGLLVYFGYPVAHEDDAQRAVRAGLEIVQAIRGQVTGDGGQARRQPLQVRIGIHTGLVVVGEIGSSEKREMLALGETPNLAARIQGQAEPDEVVISTTIYRLVEGLFECEDRGQPELKGVTTPLTLYRVVKESEAQSRFEVAVSTGLTPLVGREEELGLLQRCWTQAKEGAGQVVLLSGEPGIGKSRLVQALKEQIGQEDTLRIEFRCSPYHHNSAFYPILEHLQRLLRFHREETPQARLVKLQQMLSRYRFPQVDALPLLAALLSLPHPESCAPLTLSPQKQKQKTQEALVAWIIEEAEKTAVYCAWEDLHWADPSTLEVLTLFLEQIPTTRVFTVLTFRPDFTPPWGPRSYLTPLMLRRLPHSQAEEMVTRVTGGKALPAEVLRQVVSKTDGVPLFVEELTKMMVESGLLRVEDNHYQLTGPLPPLAIPSTLQDSLMARLDRLAPVKEVVQLGATLGREFSYEVLQAVSALDEVTLQRELAQLVNAELLFQRGVPPQARYVFKHALVQDAAYQSLLKSKRQQYHQQIAQVLEARFTEIRETQPELLAHHYTEAGLLAQAISYWQKAGQQAVKRSANREAISHLARGLELLKMLPDVPERTQQELMLQLTLAAPLAMTKGYAASEVEEAYARALALCRQVGETPQLFPILLGLWRFYVVRAQYKTARELGEQLLRLAQSTHDQAFLLGAHNALGVTLFYLGEFMLAQVHVEEGLALYDPQQHSPNRSQIFRAGQDPGVACQYHAAQVLWSLGYSEQAMRRIHEAFILARSLVHPFSLAYALATTAYLHQRSRNAQVVQEQAEASIALSTEQGYALWVAHGAILRGWALTEQGHIEEGLTLIRHGLATARSAGAELGLTYFLTLLAEAYGKMGQAEEGLTTLAEALTLVDKTGERYYEAELYRLYGELSLRAGETAKRRTGEGSDVAPSPDLPIALSSPEACFHKAIDIARRQSAKSLELRATVSLSQLWQQQGKQKEAHEMLSEVYDWFTEGFDTKDLQEAKALLDELREESQYENERND
jgi:predicted ATPase/class 3 adenylate cyclase